MAPITVAVPMVAGKIVKTQLKSKESSLDAGSCSDVLEFDVLEVVGVRVRPDDAEAVETTALDKVGVIDVSLLDELKVVDIKRRPVDVIIAENGVDDAMMLLDDIVVET